MMCPFCKVSPFISSFSFISFTVQTTSNPLLGTVSGTVTLVVEVAVLLLKMIGCVVQDVPPRPGVPTTSSLELEIVHGVGGTAKKLTSAPVGEYCQLRACSRLS